MVESAISGIVFIVNEAVRMFVINTSKSGFVNMHILWILVDKVYGNTGSYTGLMVEVSVIYPF